MCNKGGVSLYLYKYIELTVIVEILLTIYFVFLGGEGGYGELSFSYLSFLVLHIDILVDMFSH